MFCCYLATLVCFFFFFFFGGGGSYILQSLHSFLYPSIPFNHLPSSASPVSYPSLTHALKPTLSHAYWSHTAVLMLVSVMNWFANRMKSYRN